MLHYLPIRADTTFQCLENFAGIYNLVFGKMNGPNIPRYFCHGYLIWFSRKVNDLNFPDLGQALKSIQSK